MFMHNDIGLESDVTFQTNFSFSKIVIDYYSAFCNMHGDEEMWDLLDFPMDFIPIYALQSHQRYFKSWKEVLYSANRKK